MFYRRYCTDQFEPNIDEAGNAGPLSGVLSLNTRESAVLFNGDTTLTSSTLEALADVFMDITTGSLPVGIVIGWQVKPVIEALTKRAWVSEHLDPV